MAMDSIFRKSFIAFLVVWSGVQHNEVHGTDVVINCENFRDGVVTTVGGKLYKANISTVCNVFAPTKVTFLLTYPSTVTENQCEQPLSPCNNTVNGQGCRCVSDGADAYTFEFNFRFNKSKHEGSTLSLTTDCISTIPGGLTSDVPCDLKEETPSTSDQGCSICSKGTDCDEPDLICLLFLLLLIPIVILIITLWYFFVHKPKTDATKKAEEGEPKSLPQDQRTTNGSKPADGNGSGQRDNKVGTGHVATNGARNGERVSKPVQETELTKVRKASSPPSGEDALEKGEMEATTRSGQRDNKVDADHVATNGAS